MRHRILALSWIVAAVALAGCATEPTADLQSARQSLANAESAEAADYAPEAWATVRDLNQRLESELALQHERSALVRSYGTAQELALNLRDAADKAVSEAASGKERMRNETAVLVTKAKTEYEAVTRLVERAPKGKGTEADLASLKSDTQSVESTLQEMDAAFQAGDYIRAKSAAEAVLATTERLKGEVQGAKTASLKSNRT